MKPLKSIQSRLPARLLAGAVAFAAAGAWASPAIARDGGVRGSVSVQVGPAAVAVQHGSRPHAHPRAYPRAYPRVYPRVYPRIYVAPPLFFAPFPYGYSYPYGYPYAYPYGYPYGAPYPYPDSEPQPSEYVERAPDATSEAPAASQLQPGYWYWCSDPQGYYPTVPECPQGWLQVAPQPSQTR